VIGTDAATLSRAAFDVAPARAVEHGQGIDAMMSTIVRRLGAYLPDIMRSSVRALAYDTVRYAVP
jgi:hypothetical protein